MIVHAQANTIGRLWHLADIVADAEHLLGAKQTS
jgi:hypothetical protein